MQTKINTDEVIQFVQQIIRISSMSGEERGVASAIQSKMASLHYDQSYIDPYGNIVGIKKGKHPGPTILFDGHMDTVPVTNLDQWLTDPFSGSIIDGKIYGRGASDMKGPLGAAVVAIGQVPAEEIHGTIVVTGSVGEEIHEGAAVAKILEQIHPDFVVICEPNGGNIGIGQKGRAGLWVQVIGKPAHSSVPHLGENAVYKAVPIIERLRKMPLPSHPLLGDGIMELIDGISSPYPSQSTLPVSFKMRFDRRLVTGETIESVLESIKSALHDIPDWEADFATVKVDTYTGKVLEEIDFHPGWSVSKDNPWIQKAAAGFEKAGLPFEFTTAKFCTNGSQTAGFSNIPTMIFGPSSGMLAHCINEFIDMEELIQGAQGYAELARCLGK
jgi:putative selenium metabolism hydrolase